jgi:hypothetical protein
MHEPETLTVSAVHEDLYESNQYETVSWVGSHNRVRTEIVPTEMTIPEKNSFRPTKA